MSVRTFAALSLAALSSAQHNHAEQGSGPASWEWAGMFAVDGHDLTYSFQPVGGSWAESSIRVVILPATAVTDAGLHALEAEANHGFAETCTEREPCEVDSTLCTITPVEDACFFLHLEGTTASFTIRTTGMTGIAIFAEHFMSEFEPAAGPHYLREGTEDIEPVATIAGDDAHDHGATAPAGGLSSIATVIIVVGAILGVIIIIGVAGYFNNSKPAVSGAPDTGVMAAA